MTGHHPYKSEGVSQLQRFKLIAKGVRAKLPSKVERSKDPAIVALKEAFQNCQMFWPDSRPSARDIAKELTAVLESLPAPEESR